MRKDLMSSLIAAVGLCAAFLCMAPATAQAGLYEQITQEGGVSWGVDMNPDPDKMGQPLEKVLIRKPRKAKLVDERYDPTIMVRTLFVSTLEDELPQVDGTTQEPVFNEDGSPKLVRSTSMDPSLFGHREGFVLENVELGLQGRFNDAGFYYKAKFELVPKEKDGNRSSDYLKDAYLGWDYYSVFDLRIGRMKIPFSQANLTSTGDRVMVYSPILDTLIPKRQLGVQMAFADPWQVFTLTGGVFNSVALAIEQMKDLDQLLYVGRADIRLHNLLHALNVHVWDFEFKLGGGAAWVEKNFDPSTEHRWVGVDLHAHLYLFTVEGELTLKDYYETGLDTAGAETLTAQRGWGWNWDFIFHAWPGVIDTSFRVEMMDGDNTDAWYDPTFPIDGLVRSKKMWYTIGLTFHPWKYARVDFNYIIRQEKEDYAFDNDAMIMMFQLDI
jgi:hypothetical protein